MKKLSILFMLMGLTLSAQAAVGASQCRISCSKCDDMTLRQDCLQNCRGQANTQACRAVTPKILSVTDANNFGAEQFATLKAGLLHAVPTVQSVIENSGNNFKYANQAGSVDAKLVQNVQEFFQRMGAHAGKFVMNMELMAKKKGSNVEAVMQIKALFEKAVKATAAMTRQQSQTLGDLRKFQTLSDLRKYANNILLDYKNIFGQGSSLKYMIDTAKTEPAKVASVKGVNKAMLCNLQCRASSCGKSASLTAKCMANCEPKKIANCTATAKKTGTYAQAESLLNITPVASGILTPPKKELYQGEGDIGDHDAMDTGRVTQEKNAHALRLQQKELYQGEGDIGDHDAVDAGRVTKEKDDHALRLQRLREARDHFYGQQMNDQRRQAGNLPPYPFNDPVPAAPGMTKQKRQSLEQRGAVKLPDPGKLVPYEGTRRVGRAAAAAPSAQELDEGWIDPANLPPESAMMPSKVPPLDQRPRSGTDYSLMPSVGTGGGDTGPTVHANMPDELTGNMTGPGLKHKRPTAQHPPLQRRGTVFSNLPELRRGPAAAPVPVPAG
jgi:hypothetical protein